MRSAEEGSFFLLKDYASGYRALVLNLLRLLKVANSPFDWVKITEAFKDARLSSVTENELPHLIIKVPLLSPAWPIRDEQSIKLVNTASLVAR